MGMARLSYIQGVEHGFPRDPYQGQVATGADGSEWVWFNDGLSGWTDFLPSIINAGATVTGGLLARSAANKQAKAAEAIAAQEAATAQMQIQAQASSSFNLSKFVAQNQLLVYGLAAVFAYSMIRK